MRKGKKSRAIPNYIIFSEAELISLLICLILDIIEYIVVILLIPVVGDSLDIIGIVASLFMFRWIGLISLVELLPGADILPIFILTWLIWYFVKKQSEKKAIL